MRIVNIILILITFVSSVFSLEVPNYKTRVNDLANILNTSQEQAIEEYLANIEKTTSCQVALLTIKSLEGESIEDYSMRVAEKWKVGQKGLDNGAILLVSLNDRKLRIEVGYGLEAHLTDAKSSYIIRKNIVPSFKRNDFVGGIYNGLQAIGGIVSNEYDISPQELAKFNKKHQKRSQGVPLGAIIFVIIIVLGNIGRGQGSGGGFLSGMLLGSLLSSSSRSSGFGSSDSGFGGFGGFGGGGFGGGGASGDW